MDLERLDLNDLAGSQKGKNSPTLTLPDRLNVDIVLAVSELIYKDARVEHVQTHIKAKNERFELDRLQAALPFGRLSASLQTTREKGAFHQFTGSVSLDLDTLDVDGLLKMEVFTSSNNTAGNQQKKQFGIPANNNIEVQVMADEIRYRDLVLDNLEMVSGIEGQQLEVETLKLNFAGGDMELKARLEPDNNDQFSGYLYAKGNEIEIEQVFSSFNNFNQDAFTADNSSGEVSLAAHIYFMLNEDGALVRDENFSLMNLQVHNAEFDRVEPIEKTLFFVGHKTKDKMKVHQLNLNAYLVGEELIFRDVYMNDNIADLGLFGIIDVEEKAMDLGLEISLTDLFFRSKQRRMENKDQGLYSLEKDSKLFLHLYRPLADHKIRKISNRKFTNYWEALNADIKSAVQSMRQKQAELSD